MQDTQDVNTIDITVNTDVNTDVNTVNTDVNTDIIFKYVTIIYGRTQETFFWKEILNFQIILITN